jgi:hypothetical protein
MARIIKKYSPDFTKLQITYSSKIQKGWAGDWNIRTNTIKVHRGLTNVDKCGVMAHEFIEMMVTVLMGIPGYPHSDYRQKIHGEKNQMAHDYANKVEREILEMIGVDWDEHEKRVDKIRYKKYERS